MKHENPWKKVGTRLIYENPWITIREDKVVCPDGSDGIYGVVETRGATAVLALNDKQEIYLVGQYRYPIEEYSWEIIEGGTDPDEDPLEAAKRELKEEAGLVAKTWRSLGCELHLSNCFSNERGYIYVATDLTEVPVKGDPNEILALKKVPFKECVRMVEAGEITDSLSIIGILKLARELGI